MARSSAGAGAAGAPAGARAVRLVPGSPLSPGGGAGASRQPGRAPGGRALPELRPPREKLQENLTSPCKAVIFPASYASFFRQRGKTQGEKKGLKARALLRKAEIWRIFRYGLAGPTRRG